jgi:NAD(P)-dependent dehydrogenase (short-subunit alcohol dehydrogenase family)
VEGVPGVVTSEQTAENYRQTFDINVLGVLLSMKHQIRAMLKNGAQGPGQAGAIVNNASIVGSVGMAGMGVYVASKHAVIGLSKSAALEVGKSNIRVNTVSPAVIETPMFDRFSTAFGPQMRDQMAAMHPVGRVGTPEDIANAVVWLCHPSSGFVTGTDVLVDGGYTAQ